MVFMVTLAANDLDVSMFLLVRSMWGSTAFFIVMYSMPCIDLAKPNISAQELNLLQDNDKKVPTKGRSSFEARIRVHG